MRSYQDAGVNKAEGYKSVDLIKTLARRTYTDQVLTDIGSFGALYQLGNYTNPVLVSGTDGVGTKLKIAFALQQYTTIGIDCVAMCVNDILCHGATPLFFLDYLACGKLDAPIAAQIVSGIAEGCLLAGAALVGGETAEMPGFYTVGDYDIAGFAVGVVEKEQIINGRTIQNGDQIIGLASSGLHSNGFSLVRSLITDYRQDFNGQMLGNVLLTPTKIYVKSVLTVIAQYPVAGIAHITGGGLIENVPRIIPNGLMAVIDKRQIPTPAIFNFIASLGVNEAEMFGTFNMGIGLVLVVKPTHAAAIMALLTSLGENPVMLGHITTGNNKLCLN